MDGQGSGGVSRQWSLCGSVVVCGRSACGAHTAQRLPRVHGDRVWNPRTRSRPVPNGSELVHGRGAGGLLGYGAGPNTRVCQWLNT